LHRVVVIARYAFPVVACHFRRPIHGVVCDKEFSVGPVGFEEATPCVGRGGWPGFVIVTDDVVLAALASVRAVAHPVVNYVVSEVNKFFFRMSVVPRTADPQMSAVVIGDQYVVNYSSNVTHD